MSDPVAMGFRGRALRLNASDIASAAKRIGCEPAVISALLAVESSGGGFDTAGRPKILFEPHKFYEALASSRAKLAAAVKAGVAYEVWGSQPYPPTSDANYDRLVKACAIDHDAGLSSASWGIAQVMGSNWKTCNFGDVSAMVLSAMDSEAAQLGMMLSYMEHADLSVALRTKQWALIAERYNGPGQVAAYAAKLAAAYAHAAKTPQTANAPVPVEASTDSLNDQEWLRIRAAA